MKLSNALVLTSLATAIGCSDEPKATSTPAPVKKEEVVYVQPLTDLIEQEKFENPKQAVEAILRKAGLTPKGCRDFAVQDTNDEDLGKATRAIQNDPSALCVEGSVGDKIVQVAFYVDHDGLVTGDQASPSSHMPLGSGKYGKTTANVNIPYDLSCDAKLITAYNCSEPRYLPQPACSEERDRRAEVSKDISWNAVGMPNGAAGDVAYVYGVAAYLHSQLRLRTEDPNYTDPITCINWGAK